MKMSRSNFFAILSSMILSFSLLSGASETPAKEEFVKDYDLLSKVRIEVRDQALFEEVLKQLNSGMSTIFHDGKPAPKELTPYDVERILKTGICTISLNADYAGTAPISTPKVLSKFHQRTAVKLTGYGETRALTILTNINGLKIDCYRTSEVEKEFLWSEVQKILSSVFRFTLVTPQNYVPDDALNFFGEPLSGESAKPNGDCTEEFHDYIFYFSKFQQLDLLGIVGLQLQQTPLLLQKDRPEDTIKQIADEIKMKKDFVATRCRHLFKTWGNFSCKYYYDDRGNFEVVTPDTYRRNCEDQP